MAYKKVFLAENEAALEVFINSKNNVTILIDDSVGCSLDIETAVEVKEELEKLIKKMENAKNV